MKGSGQNPGGTDGYAVLISLNESRTSCLVLPDYKTDQITWGLCIQIKPEDQLVKPYKKLDFFPIVTKSTDWKRRYLKSLLFNPLSHFKSAVPMQSFMVEVEEDGETREEAVPLDFNRFQPDDQSLTVGSDSSLTSSRREKLYNAIATVSNRVKLTHMLCCSIWCHVQRSLVQNEEQTTKFWLILRFT